MRHLLAILAVTGVAHADAGWSEYSAAVPLRPAEKLTETACDIAVELRGAIADVQMHRRISNPTTDDFAAVTEFALPQDGKLIAATIQHGRYGKAQHAIAVSAPVTSDHVTADSVLGADPAIITALQEHDGRPRFRAVIQPIGPEQEVVLGVHWTAIAKIRGGALELVLPGRDDTSKSVCRVVVHAAPGPGVTVERIRVGGTDVGSRGTAAFDHGAQDSTISAVLAFKQPKPVLWSQTAALGDGMHAQAITIVTPPLKSTVARRALLVIDGSRSMELAGRHNVQKLVRAITAALPQQSELDAIVFDRKATRVLGAFKAPTAEHIKTIETTLANRTAVNGSDTAGALAYARSLVADLRGPTMIVLITDGVLGDVAPNALAQALNNDTRSFDLHAIALAPGRMHAPDAAHLRAAVDRIGGSFVEVSTKDVDLAVAELDQWLRPAWLELALTGTDLEIPDQLRAGSGVVVTSVVAKPASKLELKGHADSPIKVKATTGPSAPLGPLAVAHAIYMSDDRTGSAAANLLEKLRTRHPTVDAEHAFVVMTSVGKVAASRSSMVTGGGPYTRMIAVDDPKFPADILIGQPIVLGGSAIDRNALTLMLRTHLQPAAFTCYQRALGKNGSLAGTAKFKLEIGRGETTRAEVTGIGDPDFDACLLDAAFMVTPPLPNPDYNTDDRTIVNYPLTFSVREQKPFVIAGDADSSSPLNIDAIEGGPPISRKKQVKAGDTSTPLGDLRPAPTK